MCCIWWDLIVDCVFIQGKSDLAQFWISATWVMKTTQPNVFPYHSHTIPLHKVLNHITITSWGWLINREERRSNFQFSDWCQNHAEYMKRGTWFLGSTFFSDIIVCFIPGMYSFSVVVSVFGQLHWEFDNRGGVFSTFVKRF